MTAAGATFPHGCDPQDSNVRIAPSLPPVDEPKQASDVFCTCLRLAALERLPAVPRAVGCRRAFGAGLPRLCRGRAGGRRLGWSDDEARWSLASGGVDSSAAACLAMEAGSAPGATMRLFPDEPACGHPRGDVWRTPFAAALLGIPTRF